jgi:UDP-N-acetylglucosamine--dolichyl-phosphate N-acetylglucosaminephosphotransferase
MLDVINGSAATGGLVVMIVMLIVLVVMGRSVNILPLLLGIAALIGFLYYNRYPSKVFLGNAPALVIGGYIAALAIIYNVEFPTVVSMFPFIHNSFFFLNKIRGFVEHKKLKVKVTYIDDEECIHDAGDDRAPITLLRFLVSRDPLSEYDAYLNIVLLFLFSGFLAVLSAILMRWF